MGLDSVLENDTVSFLANIVGVYDSVSWTVSSGNIVGKTNDSLSIFWTSTGTSFISLEVSNDNCSISTVHTVYIVEEEDTTVIIPPTPIYSLTNNKHIFYDAINQTIVINEVKPIRKVYFV